MDTFQALMVDIHFLTRLVDDLPAYITPDWNAKAVHFVQKIPMCLISIRNHCEAALDDISDEDVQRAYIMDVSTPLVALKAYNELLSMYLVPDDPVILLLNEIYYYIENMQETVNSLREKWTQ